MSGKKPRRQRRRRSSSSFVPIWIKLRTDLEGVAAFQLLPPRGGDYTCSTCSTPGRRVKVEITKEYKRNGTVVLTFDIRFIPLPNSRWECRRRTGLLPRSSLALASHPSGRSAVGPSQRRARCRRGRGSAAVGSVRPLALARRRLGFDRGQPNAARHGESGRRDAREHMGAVLRRPGVLPPVGRGRGRRGEHLHAAEGRVEPGVLPYPWSHSIAKGGAVVGASASRPSMNTN